MFLVFCFELSEIQSFLWLSSQQILSSRHIKREKNYDYIYLNIRLHSKITYVEKSAWTWWIGCIKAEQERWWRKRPKNARLLLRLIPKWSYNSCHSEDASKMRRESSLGYCPSGSFRQAFHRSRRIESIPVFLVSSFLPSSSSFFLGKTFLFSMWHLMSNFKNSNFEM